MRAGSICTGCRGRKSLCARVPFDALSRTPQTRLAEVLPCIHRLALRFAPPWQPSCRPKDTHTCTVKCIRKERESVRGRTIRTHVHTHTCTERDIRRECVGANNTHTCTHAHMHRKRHPERECGGEQYAHMHTRKHENTSVGEMALVGYENYCVK